MVPLNQIIQAICGEIKLFEPRMRISYKSTNSKLLASLTYSFLLVASVRQVTKTRCFSVELKIQFC